jgi:hypothetical protein
MDPDPYQIYVDNNRLFFWIPDPDLDLLPIPDPRSLIPKI